MMTTHQMQKVLAQGLVPVPHVMIVVRVGGERSEARSKVKAKRTNSSVRRRRKESES